MLDYRNNYYEIERLNVVMRNLCYELVEDYTIEEYGSVEDAYYLIDQNCKPVIVATICRKVSMEDYKEKAIFYIDSDDVAKLFLMNINCKVSGNQIPSMTFDYLFVLYDIFKQFIDEYDSYKRYLACMGNDELERKGYEAGTRNANNEDFMKTYEKEDIKNSKKIIDEIENAIKKGIIEGYAEWLMIDAKNKEAEASEKKEDAGGIRKEDG